MLRHVLQLLPVQDVVVKLERQSAHHPSLNGFAAVDVLLHPPVLPEAQAVSFQLCKRLRNILAQLPLSRDAAFQEGLVKWIPDALQAVAFRAQADAVRQFLFAVELVFEAT